MKHTPGPWEVTEDGEADFSGIATQSNWLMRIQQNGELSVQEEEANANLIAAAPELLAALEALEPHMDAIVCYASTLPEFKPNLLVVNAQAAIRKAKGGEQV